MGKAVFVHHPQALSDTWPEPLHKTLRGDGGRGNLSLPRAAEVLEQASRWVSRNTVVQGARRLGEVRATGNYSYRAARLYGDD
jgi:hypothetical protein